MTSYFTHHTLTSKWLNWLERDKEGLTGNCTILLFSTTWKNNSADPTAAIRGPHCVILMFWGFFRGGQGLDNQHCCFGSVECSVCGKHYDNLTRSLSLMYFKLTSFRVDVAVWALYCRYYIDVRQKMLLLFLKKKNISLKLLLLSSYTVVS